MYHVSLSYSITTMQQGLDDDEHEKGRSIITVWSID